MSCQNATPGLNKGSQPRPENLEINDDTLELEGGDEAEDLTKKLLDEQGKHFCQKFKFLISFFFKCNVLLIFWLSRATCGMLVS